MNVSKRIQNMRELFGWKVLGVEFPALNSLLLKFFCQLYEVE